MTPEVMHPELAPEFAFTLPDLAASQALGTLLGQTLGPATVLLLQGNLGSGKTTLVQSLGAAIGITTEIVSPTFTLVNEYLEGRLPFYHLDLYRLEPPEVADLHPEHYWQGEEFPLGIVAIEWPERLLVLPPSYHPPSYLQISLEIPQSPGSGPDEGRRVKLLPKGGFELSSLRPGLANFVKECKNN
jgi:tRNA threonylcarbamoyladenosine biosynthesis protein TsaE